MKIRKRPITAADDLSVNRCMFTPEDVAAFLSQIYELQGLGISIKDKAEGSAEFTIGDSVYNIANL